MTGADAQESQMKTGHDDAGAAGEAELPRLRSADLLNGAREAIIEHGQDRYRLRLTSNGKLILTK